MPAEQLSISVVETSSAFLRMRESWDDLCRRNGSGHFFHSFNLQNLRAPSNLGHLMGKLAGVQQVGGGWSPVARLERYEDWTAFARRLPRSMLNDQRRQWTRTRELLPQVAFEILEDEPRVDATLRWIMDRKLEWLRDKSKTGLQFMTPEIRALMHQGPKVALPHSP